MRTLVAVGAEIKIILSNVSAVPYSGHRLLYQLVFVHNPLFSKLQKAEDG